MALRLVDAAAHVGGTDAAGALDMTWFHEHMSATGWEEALRERLDKAQLGALRSRWERGWPLAGDRWIAKTERLLGRRLRPLPVGWQKGRQRPKRKTRIVAAPDQQQQ